MTFKKTQKVVCITNHFSYLNQEGRPENVPGKHEIVTIEKISPLYPDYVLISEYLFDTDGSLQHFHHCLFRPVVYNNEAMIELLSMPFTEERLEIQKEPVEVFNSYQLSTE